MLRLRGKVLLGVIILVLAAVGCQAPGQIVSPDATPTPTVFSVQAETEDPTAAASPEPDEPATDYSSVTLTPQDLPAGFQELSEADLEAMGISPKAFVQAFSENLTKASVQTFSAYWKTNNLEIVADFVMAPITLVEQVAFDLLLKNPEKVAELFAKNVGVTVQVVPVETVGNASVQLSYLQATSTGINLVWDIMIFRRGEAAVVALAIHLEQAPPITLYDIAVLLDAKIQAVQGK